MTQPDKLLGWQPIETAPKDGTPILGYCPGLSNNREYCQPLKSDFHVVAWGTDMRRDGGWIGDIIYEERDYYGYNSAYLSGVNPTHWMPLPKEPSND